MTEALDLVTIFRVSALLFLLMSVTTWWLLGRPQRGPVLVWCMAGVLVGVSSWLITQRGHWHDVWTYTVAQPLLLLSYLLYGQAMCMDMGRAWRWRVLIGAVVVYAACMALFFGWRTSWPMAVTVRCANSAALLATLWASLVFARQTASRHAWFMCAGFALFTLSMLTNTVMTWWGFSALDRLQWSVFNHLNGWVSILTVLLCYLGYLGLALERAQAVNARSRQAQWQAQQWRQQGQALMQMDRQRTLSLLANSLGHGLMQPLTATRLQVQLAGAMARNAPTQDAARSAAVSEALQNAIESLDRSADMVDRIRNFLRPVPSASSTVTVQAVLQDAQDLLGQALLEQGVHFTRDVPLQPVRVQAEGLLLTQAVVQVLRNAMAAVQGRAAPHIRMRLFTTAQEACIEVIDSGPGLTAALLEELRSSAQPLVDGQTGLGLYMTRGVMSQFQGHLSVSNLPSGGACVQLCLPLIASSS